MSYPPGQQPPTWGPGQQPPTWNQQPPPPGWSGPPPQYYSVNPSKAGTNPVAIVGIFVGILVLVIGIAAAFIFFNQPPAPAPPCQPGLPCSPVGPSLPPISQASPSPAPAATSTPQPTTPTSSVVPGSPAPSGQPTAAPGSPAPTQTPTSDSPPVVLGGSSWQSATLGFGFEYDGDIFQLSPQSDDSLAILNLPALDSQIVIVGTDEGITPSQMIDRQVGIVDGFLVGRTDDKDDYDAVLGPGIGYLDGDVKVFSGILTNSDGTPAAPGGVTIMAATNGRLTVAMVVIVPQPDAQFGSDTAQYVVRSVADDIVKSFYWGDPP